MTGGVPHQYSFVTQESSPVSLFHDSSLYGPQLTGLVSQSSPVITLSFFTTPAMKVAMDWMNGVNGWVRVICRVPSSTATSPSNSLVVPAKTSAYPTMGPAT